MTKRSDPDPSALHADLCGFVEGRPAFREFCREPLLAAAAADDPRWLELRHVAQLCGKCAVVCPAPR